LNNPVPDPPEGKPEQPEGKRALGYGLSTAVFVASAFVPGPWRYVLWGLTLLQEAGFLLLRNGELPTEGGAEQARRKRWAARRGGRGTFGALGPS
jgi:hypothetical protein